MKRPMIGIAGRTLTVARISIMPKSPPRFLNSPRLFIKWMSRINTWILPPQRRGGVWAAPSEFRSLRPPPAGQRQPALLPRRWAGRVAASKSGAEKNPCVLPQLARPTQGSKVEDQEVLDTYRAGASRRTPGILAWLVTMYPELSGLHQSGPTRSRSWFCNLTVPTSPNVKPGREKRPKISP